MQLDTIILISVITIALIIFLIYCVWYKIHSKKDLNFFEAQLDNFLIQLAKSFKHNKETFFIMNNDINFNLINGMKNQVHSIMITNYKLIIFKNLTKLNDDQEKENLFLSKLIKKLEISEELVLVIYQKQNKRYFKDTGNSFKNIKQFLKLLNANKNLNYTNNLNYSKIHKLISKNSS